jgi:hypothetical protein
VYVGENRAAYPGPTLFCLNDDELSQKMQILSLSAEQVVLGSFVVDHSSEQPEQDSAHSFINKYSSVY